MTGEKYFVWSLHYESLVSDEHSSPLFNLRKIFLEKPYDYTDLYGIIFLHLPSLLYKKLTTPII